MDYTKSGESGSWFFTDADISMGRDEDIIQFMTMTILGIAGAGVFVFVAIMRFGGNMSRTWNTAMDKFARPKDRDAGEAVQEAEMDAAAVNMEEDLS